MHEPNELSHAVPVRARGHIAITALGKMTRNRARLETLLSATLPDQLPSLGVIVKSIAGLAIQPVNGVWMFVKVDSGVIRQDWSEYASFRAVVVQTQWVRSGSERLEG